uniref:Uncharacterized protein n=1 Tax=Engystomops pustulosus TaxID=76066 RepID=A0AAV6YCJ4_ENGPU|nr:hypothetical protein GDO81_028988 [Engystomops pustulosus]
MSSPNTQWWRRELAAYSKVFTKDPMVEREADGELEEREVIPVTTLMRRLEDCGRGSRLPNSGGDVKQHMTWLLEAYK